MCECIHTIDLKKNLPSSLKQQILSGKVDTARINLWCEVLGPKTKTITYIRLLVSKVKEENMQQQQVTVAKLHTTAHCAAQLQLLRNQDETYFNTSINHPDAKLLTCHQYGRDVTAAERIHKLDAMGLQHRTNE